MRNNKGIKAQSDPTAIILIVIITILSISILYPIAIDLINPSPNLSPLSYKNLVEKDNIEMELSCYNQEEKMIEITLNKTGIKKIESIEFQAEFEDSTKFWSCNSNCTNCKPLEYGEKSYYLFPNQMPKRINVIIEGYNKLSKEVIQCK